MSATTAGQLLRQCRERRDMSQRELARRLGIVPPNLCDMEHDRSRIGTDHIARLIPALALTVDETEGIVQAVKDERCADLDAVLDGEYARLYPRKAVTA